jgi:hypothetical protein
VRENIENTNAQHRNETSHLDSCPDASLGFDTDAVVVAGSRRCYLEDELRLCLRGLSLQNLTQSIAQTRRPPWS